MEIAGRASRPLAELTVIGHDGKEFKVGKTVIKSQVADIKVFFGSDMNAQQIGMCAEIIYNDYKWLTAAEFKYFVNRVYSGFYSDMKNLSPAILTQWLRLFSKEILDARELNKPKWKPPDKCVSDELWNEHMASIIADLKANSLKDAESPTFPPLLEVLENLKKLQSNENESC